jgi:uncharacterized membrane protein
VNDNPELPASETGQALEKPNGAPLEGVVVNPQTGQQIGQVSITMEQSSYWSAPLPAPETLAAFNQVLPGLAERIVTRFETEASHREELEVKMVEAAIGNQSRGQVFAFIVVMTVIVGGGSPRSS